MERLLIVGASGRAAAASARRAGFEPFVLDLFADADTERLATVWKLPFDQYPHGFVELAKRVPPMPWMYTGGLENYPDVVAAISQTRELWGNGPDVLKKVRDPFLLAEILCDSYPRAARHPTENGAWLRKPLVGSAGSGIRFANAQDAARETHYFQEWIDGEPRSAAFLSDGSREVFEAEFRQLIGTDWLHARPFQYAGNLGPLSQAGADRNSFRLSDLADRLTRACGLRGLWGFDFVSTASGPKLIEVNPRFPASIELAMWSRGVLSLWTHREVFREPNALGKRKYWTIWPYLVGKAIYYAPHRIVFPASGPWDDSLARCTDVWRRPDYADLPHAGDIIEAEQPVLTIFAEATGVEDCEAKLKSQAAELDRLFAVG